MESQNELPEESELKVEFSMKGKRGRNVIVSLKAEAFNQLIKKGKVNIKWSRFNIREFINLLYILIVINTNIWQSFVSKKGNAEIVIQNLTRQQIVKKTHIVRTVKYIMRDSIHHTTFTTV